ncbi:helix-turn-helix domain-containing protein [Egicoccus sp. AB-alg2]|uniref:helix-turn-helix domain-containing protein n=1 Tax=Egicoccus sp. AB-alg2 TaxID=3242693 RepID=UPI00359CC715
MHRVAAVINQGCLTFDLAVPCEVFGWDRSYLAEDWYDFRVVAADPPPIRTATGFTIDTPHRLDVLAEADTILIPGWSDPEVAPSAELVETLHAAHERGTRLVSICVGAFVLAAAGLLDGRPATTHWAYADRFRTRFPRVRLDPRVLYVDDGQILTSAGTAAGLDLCLHLVRLDHGAEVANGVARMVVTPPHREGGQAQYIERPLAAPGRGSELQPTLEWALTRLDEPLSVGVLARHASMSPRTFARRFRQVAGTTPGEWLLEQRLTLARRLLETTDGTVDWVAHRCGFASAATLRHHFAQRLATSPRAYRFTFRGTSDDSAGPRPLAGTQR